MKKSSIVLDMLWSIMEKQDIKRYFSLKVAIIKSFTFPSFSKAKITTIEQLCKTTHAHEC